jgi:hypothetical protein
MKIPAVLILILVLGMAAVPVVTEMGAVQAVAGARIAFYVA